jgi:hypothetical protein
MELSVELGDVLAATNLWMGLRTLVAPENRGSAAGHNIASDETMFGESVNWPIQ